MRIDKLKKAKEEALRFLKTVEELEKAHVEEKRLHEEAQAKAKNMTEQQRNYLWIPSYNKDYISSRPDLRGAAKRASMDLSRSLANFRKPG